MTMPPCPHGRPNWQSCQHCTGINQRSTGAFTQVPRSVTYTACSRCEEKDEKDARIMQLGSDLLEMQKAARLIQSAHDAAVEDAKKWRRDAQKFAGKITEFRLLLDEIIPYLNEWDHPIYWVERARKLLEETKP